jgi:ferredoxin-thioredoxin reductase catalytic subunit
MSIKLNPDESIDKAIRNRLKITDNQCPCIEESQWHSDTKCPCKALREQEYCCCGLYVKVEDITNE